MSRKSPGLSKADIIRGWDIICQCSDLQELTTAIENEPILSNPDFQVAFQGRTAQILFETPEHSLSACHDDFFFLLHQRLHHRIAHEAALKTGPIPTDFYTPPSPPCDAIPSFFASIREVLAGHLPPKVDLPFEPQADAARITYLVQTITGDMRSLPSYEPVPGIRWNLLVSMCPRCKEQRLSLHPYWIDLTVNRGYISLISRLDSEASCPHCGCSVSLPLFVWIQEREGPRDILNSAATAICATKSHFIYRLAPGPQRDPNTDRILEARFSRMLNEIRPHHTNAPIPLPSTRTRPLPHGDDPAEEPMPSSDRKQWLGIAYSDQDAEEMIGSMQADASIPFEMKAFMDDVAQKLKTGVFSLSYVEESLRSPQVRLNLDWPITVDPNSFTPNPYYSLVSALVSEELARRQKLSKDLQAMLAAQTVRAYLLLREPALAEIALERAKRLVPDGPSDSLRNALRMVLQESQAALCVQLGEHAEAANIRASLSLSLAPDAPQYERIVFLQTQASLALNRFRSGQIEEAFRNFREVLPSLKSTLDETKASLDEEIPGMLADLQHSYSGALANFGTLLEEMSEFYDYLAIFNALHPTLPDTPHLSDEGLRNNLEWRAYEISSKLGLTQTKAQEFVNTIPLLDSYFSEQGIADNERHQETLWQLARSLRKQAIAISLPLNGWIFAARQAMYLASSFDKTDEHDEAEAMAKKAIEYAEHNRDHRTLISANLFLADKYGKQEDGRRAISFVRAAAREAIHQIAGFGRHGQGNSEADAIAWKALLCARFGADPLDAIMIAESMKAVSLTLSLEQPVQPSNSERLILDPAYLRWCDATWLDVDDASRFREQLQIPKRTLYIGFLCKPGRIWSYAVWADGAIVEWVPEPEDLNELRIPPFPKKGDSKQLQSWSDKVSQKLLRWSELLLHPLRKALISLSSNDRLVISVDKALADIPFAALPFCGVYLCQKTEISYVEGSGMFTASSERKMVYQSILCVGNPQRNDRIDLPSSEQEAVFVEELCRSNGLDTQLLTRKNAIFNAVSKAAPEADILHFACHADRIGEETLSQLPALFLARDETCHDAGILSGERILKELPLRQGCLVNLMACESAVRDDAVGPFVKGLVPAFLVRGAAGVLANLWPIHDTNALKFSKAFYSKLFAGTDAAEALALAQRAFIEGCHGAPHGAALHTWAGYVLYGALQGSGKV